MESLSQFAPNLTSVLAVAFLVAVLATPLIGIYKYMNGDDREKARLQAKAKYMMSFSAGELLFVAVLMLVLVWGIHSNDGEPARYMFAVVFSLLVLPTYKAWKG